MRSNIQNLGPHETTLIIQASIEGFTPQQLLVRDQLILDFGFSPNVANAVIRGGISPEEAVAMTAVERTNKNAEDLRQKFDNNRDWNFRRYVILHLPSVK